MNLRERLRNYLDTIYIPKPKKHLAEQLMFYVDEIDIRLPNKNDSHKSKYRVIMIRTKGKGTRESFDDFKIMYVDFDTIGEKYALSYVYDDDGNGYPYRMDITSIKNLIIY